jgi:hypothetical protein
MLDESRLTRGALLVSTPTPTNRYGKKCRHSLKDEENDDLNLH